MNADGKIRPFPWLGVSACALLAVVGTLVMVRPPVLPSTTRVGEVEPVAFVPLDNEAGALIDTDAMSLRDPVPLYLPTPLNSGHSEALDYEGRREPVAAFRNFPANLVFSEVSVPMHFPAPVRVPSGMVEAIGIDQGSRMFQYLGRREIDLPDLERRLGFLEVTRADNGANVLSEELADVADAPPSDWGPLDMVVAVNVTGLVGKPVVIQSSGSAPFDAWLPGYLTNSFRIGQRLQPGIYRITLGP